MKVNINTDVWKDNIRLGKAFNTYNYGVIVLCLGVMAQAFLSIQALNMITLGLAIMLGTVATFVYVSYNRFEGETWQRKK